MLMQNYYSMNIEESHIVAAITYSEFGFADEEPITTYLNNYDIRKHLNMYPDESIVLEHINLTIERMMELGLLPYSVTIDCSYYSEYIKSIQTHDTCCHCGDKADYHRICILCSTLLN